MKKFTLSTVVILSFVLYSLSARQKAAAETKTLENPPALSTTPTSEVSIATPAQTLPSPTSGASNNSPVVATATTAPVRSGPRDGQYTGSTADAFYGYIQVRATISGGRITDVVFLQYPNDRNHSIMINQYAMPILKQEAIQAQSANVNIVSGATDTSLAFRESLASALSQAK